MVSYYTSLKIFEISSEYFFTTGKNNFAENFFRKCNRQLKNKYSVKISKIHKKFNNNRVDAIEHFHSMEFRNNARNHDF
jgi:hypothetical protein